MENASKALIMAGSILIGVLIMSLMVYLFNTMGQYAAQAEERRAQTQVDMFNAEFTKYTGQITYTDENGNDVTTDVTCTMHDVITIANFARQTNESYGLYDEQNYSDDSYYVQVDFMVSGARILHLEQRINEQYTTLLNLQESDNYVFDEDYSTGERRYILKQYKCELGYSQTTGRVNYVRFTKYP